MASVQPHSEDSSADDPSHFEAAAALKAKTPSTAARILLRQARPWQWPRNLLVFGAPAAAGIALHVEVLLREAVMAMALVLAASAAYFLNDVIDRTKDRQHPVKRFRPIASGEISIRYALAWVAGLVALALILGASLGGPAAGAVAGYIFVSAVYSIVLKRIAGLEIVGVAGCYVARALAGAAPIEISISGWFVGLTALVALFVVAGKRYDELNDSRLDTVDTRPVLRKYNPRMLAAFCVLTGVGSVIVYAGWAIQRSSNAVDLTFFLLSLLTFAGAMGLYASSIASGRAESPEDVVYTDRRLLVAAACWLVAVSLAIGLR